MQQLRPITPELRRLWIASLMAPEREEQTLYCQHFSRQVHFVNENWARASLHQRFMERHQLAPCCFAL